MHSESLLEKLVHSTKSFEINIKHRNWDSNLFLSPQSLALIRLK